MPTSILPSVVDTIEPLAGGDRVNAFIVDDSLFERTSCKKRELGSKVFDHASMRYTKGYRLMALSWTDGNTMVPANSTLLASSKEQNILGFQKKYDGRSLVGRRRKLAQMKGADAMLELIRAAQAAGHSAGYVLLGTWFSCPAQLLAVKTLGLDAVAMVKKIPRIRYESNGGQLSLKKIYGICKKRMEDIPFAGSCQILVKAMFECIYAIFQVTEEQKNESVGLFIGNLPGYIQKALSRGSIAA